MIKRKTVGAGLLLALAILAVAGWIAYANTTDLIKTSRQVRHIYKVRERLEAVLAGLTNAETAARGYIIAGSEEYLGPYRAATGAVDRNLKDLGTLIADEPKQHRHLAALQPAIDAQLQLLKQGVELRKEKGLAAAAETLGAGRERELMDEIRAAVREIRSAENALLKRREHQSRGYAKKTLLTLVIGALLGFSILATVFYLLNREIIERERAEEEARQRQAELAHVLRVSTVGEMVAGLTHEINQPLAAIVSYAKGSAHRVRAGTGQPGELVEAMREIEAQAVRADQIIRRLRNFVRKQEPRRERVDLNDLIRQVARWMAGEAQQRKIIMQLDFAAGIPPVHVDGIQIEQVILNLVRNGLEAMHGPDAEHGVLSIETSLAGTDAVEVAVRDAGEGLTAGCADKVFEPFFTTKPHGMGMGLSISRSIVEGHGGRLWATPNAERGTTFRFTVPVSRGGGSDAA